VETATDPTKKTQMARKSRDMPTIVLSMIGQPKSRRTVLGLTVTCSRAQQKSRPRFLGRLFVKFSSDYRRLQLRFAAQLAASVTATGASTVVRFGDFTIVLGHVISSI